VTWSYCGLLRFPRGLPGPFRSSLSGTVPCTPATSIPVASPRLRSKMASNLLGAFVCAFIQEFSPHLLILFPPLLRIGVIDLVDRNTLECSFLKRDESPNTGLQYRHSYFLQLRAGFFTIPTRSWWNNRQEHTETTGADGSPPSSSCGSSCGMGDSDAANKGAVGRVHSSATLASGEASGLFGTGDTE